MYLSEPKPPESVTVVSQTVNNITLRWSHPDGELVRYKTILNQADAEDNEVNTHKIFMNLIPGTEYIIKIYSEAGDGTGSEMFTHTYYTGKFL